MVGTVLAVCVGVNPPQSAPPQVTDQLTLLVGSLVMVAAMPHCSLTIRDVGGMKAGVKITVMAGGVEFWPQPLRK